uniref:Fatty acid 2-hydroxylase-like n=1 Tax=Petromyzon marinus TaxID=7757 RepID=A0AAJ7X0A8_PETMA|nr:fatty acid 2-hydroxylase-like [Petromyzon marinus]
MQIEQGQQQGARAEDYGQQQQQLIGGEFASPACKRFTLAELEAHSSEESCWVVHAGRVFDVTRFVRIHPGGEAVIVTRGGTDLGRLLSGPPHRHSSNAYRWLEQYCIGELDTRLGEELDGGSQQQEEQQRQRADASVVTPPGSECAEEVRRRNGSSVDRRQDTEELMYKTVSTDNDLVDWSKALLWQVGHLGDKYNEWVHQPVDRRIRLFESDFLEFWSKTAWYVIPLVWIPIIVYMGLSSYRGLQGNQIRVFTTFTDGGVNVSQDWFACLFTFGFFMWSLVEYSLHRFLFHLTPPAHSYLLITLHFLLHGQHHKSPFDGSRLVFPPVAAFFFVAPFYSWMLTMLPNAVTGSLMAGGISGYVIYDLMHYYLHYGAPSRGSYLYSLKAYHIKHHFEHQALGFGISSKLWDYPFRTLIPEETFEKSR